MLGFLSGGHILFCSQTGGRAKLGDDYCEAIRMTFSNRMQERLARGEVALCMATRLARTVEIAMIADSCGFDALFIDMEHCPISLDTAAQICVAALPVGVTPLVRIAGHRFEDATRLLDMGALGIICPDVSTRAEAESFVRACRFPPLGGRSVGGAGPLQCYRATPLAEVNKQGNAATVLIAMLETPEGIANADVIAAVPGIDVLLIGSNDLCTAMGIAGELKSPKLRAAYESVAKACKAHDKHLGIGGIRADVEHVAELVKLGARFVITASDMQYLIKAARDETASLRKAFG
jgi:2-keto-3-deoxy-L-rhamnonate aldolase RhmA